FNLDCLAFSPFFFNAPAPTDISTLSLHDALPIFFFCGIRLEPVVKVSGSAMKPNSALFHRIMSSDRREKCTPISAQAEANSMNRSEEHTSELQSRENLVCRLLLEKKKTTQKNNKQ